jgi:hypothetical protein
VKLIEKKINLVNGQKIKKNRLKIDIKNKNKVAIKR